jgi:CheY-like chemotaxis protein
MRILVVDDQADARELLHRVLHGRGRAAVTTASSAAEGLSLLKRDRPDVLVCDIGMPDIDGYAFIRAVRALPPEQGGRTPALALTAFARPEDRTRALVAGYNLHLAKPADPTELLATLATLTPDPTA